MKRIAYFCRTSIAVFFCLFEFMSFTSADNSGMVAFVDQCDDTEPNMTRCGPMEELEMYSALPNWNLPTMCRGNISRFSSSYQTCGVDHPSDTQCYFCHEFTDATSLRMDDPPREVTANKIDLLSPNFPCEIPDRKFNISCTIFLNGHGEGADRSRGSNPIVDAIAKLIRFNNGEEECDPQDLRDTQICSLRGEARNVCWLDSPTFIPPSTRRKRTIRNHSIVQLGDTNWFKLRYRNRSGRRSSGKLWIQLQARENRNITVTCKDSLSGQAGDDNGRRNTQPSSNSPDITSDIPTTSELPSTQPASFEDDGNEGEGELNSSVDLTTDGAEDTELEVDEASKMVANKDQSSGNSVPAVVGGVVGGLVLVAAVAGAVFCLKRGPKKGQESSAAETPAPDGPKVALQPTAPLYEVVQDEQLSPRKQNPMAYDNVVPIENESETAKVEQSSPKRVKPGVYDNLLPLENKHVYSELDINGKMETNQALDDHTIMVENDELYTTRDVVPGASTHDVNDYVDIIDVDEYAVVNKAVRKSDDVKESDEITLKASVSPTDEDEVIMRENNDLYEAATTTQEAGDKKTNNKETENDDDSTIMFENNELYTSSMDLAKDGQELSKLQGSNRRMSFA